MADGGPPMDVMAPQAPPYLAVILIGPSLVGWCVQMMLFGLTVGLFISYAGSRDWKSDSRGLRWLMIAVMILNGIQTLINAEETVWYGTSQNRDIASLAGYTLVDCFVSLPQGFLGALVQIYLARRATILIHNVALRCLLIVAFALGIVGAFTGAIGMCVIFLQSYYGADVIDRPFNFNSASSLYLVSSAFVDCLVTLTLGVTLTRQIRGFNAVTDSTLRRLARLAIRTAAYTAINAVIGTVLSLVFNADSQYPTTGIPFVAIMPSLYVLSLFTVVTGRKAIAHEQATSVLAPSHPRRPDTTGLSSADNGTVNVSHISASAFRRQSLVSGMETSTHTSTKPEDATLSKEADQVSNV